MADWIKGKRQEYEAQKDAKQIEQKLQLHKADILKAKARGVLDAITEAVARDVQVYQAEFEGVSEKRVDFNRKPSGGFSLAKQTYPSASMECTMEAPDSIIANYRFRRDADSSGWEKQERIRLQVDTNDNIVMTSSNRNLSSWEDASRLLIEEVLSF